MPREEGPAQACRLRLALLSPPPSSLFPSEDDPFPGLPGGPSFSDIYGFCGNRGDFLPPMPLSVFPPASRPFESFPLALVAQASFRERNSKSCSFALKVVFLPLTSFPHRFFSCRSSSSSSSDISRRRLSFPCPCDSLLRLAPSAKERRPFAELPLPCR